MFIDPGLPWVLLRSKERTTTRLLPLTNQSAPSNGAGVGVGLRSIDISPVTG